MSASHEWTEYHLTPRGWEQGSYQRDFAKRQDEPPPADRVLTKIYGERLSSMFSKKPELYENETWRGTDADAIARLQRKFGTCPEAERGLHGN